MFERLKASWKKFRNESRDYDIDRAMYQQGGGAERPPTPGGIPYAPPTVSHDTDVSKLSDDT